MIKKKNGMKQQQQRLSMGCRFWKVQFLAATAKNCSKFGRRCEKGREGLRRKACEKAVEGGRSFSRTCLPNLVGVKSRVPCALTVTKHEGGGGRRFVRRFEREGR